MVYCIAPSLVGLSQLIHLSPPSSTLCEICFVYVTFNSRLKIYYVNFLLKSFCFKPWVPSPPPLCQYLPSFGLLISPSTSHSYRSSHPSILVPYMTSSSFLPLSLFLPLNSFPQSLPSIASSLKRLILEQPTVAWTSWKSSLHSKLKYIF